MQADGVFLCLGFAYCPFFSTFATRFGGRDNGERDRRRGLELF